MAEEGQEEQRSLRLLRVASRSRSHVDANMSMALGGPILHPDFRILSSANLNINSCSN